MNPFERRELPRLINCPECAGTGKKGGSKCPNPKCVNGKVKA